MKRLQICCTFLLSIMMFLLLSACGTKILTAEDEVVNHVGVNNQGSLKLDVSDGDISVTFWQEDYIKIIECRAVRGPAKKEQLEERLEKNEYVVEATDYSVSIKGPEKTDGKSIFSMTNDMEIMVPRSINNISIKAGSGDISIAGDKRLSMVDIKLKTGRISIDKLEAERVSVNVTKGDIDISKIKGIGIFECGRGKIAIREMTGNIEARLTEGEIYIEKAEGRLNCDTSSGEINLSSSWLLKDSILYASTGNINADFELRDDEGEVKLMAAKGDIRLNTPMERGWSLIAKSTKGRIIDKQNPKQEELKISPSGEMYGDVGGGGPLIDIYVDNGSIYLIND